MDKPGDTPSYFGNDRTVYEDNPKDAVRIAGDNVEVAELWTSNVVRDREFITGQ